MFYSCISDIAKGELWVSCGVQNVYDDKHLDHINLWLNCIVPFQRSNCIQLVLVFF